MSDSARLVLPVEGSHFYTPDRRSYYNVEMKTRPGEFRRANITDAKKIGALPSVTTIGGVLAKPALEAWKINNAILAALTLPRIDGESIDDFAKRVAEDADSPSKGAADLGTTVHRAIEDNIAGRDIPAEMYKFANPVYNWIGQEGISITESEVIKINVDHKYGCRIDAIAIDRAGATCIIDWKTQKSPKGKLTAYDEMGYQLAGNAAAAGVGTVKARLINVIISTTSLDADGNALILVKEWSDEEKAQNWEMFCMCRKIYAIKNGI